MDEIKINEYVRFKNGEIGKVLEIKENPLRVVYSEYGEINIVEDIVKHSPDIIDLIEIGDYVNGMLVVNVLEFNDIKLVFVNRDKKSIQKPLSIYNKDIKSIVTKEQFANIEYKIEE